MLIDTNVLAFCVIILSIGVLFAMHHMTDKQKKVAVRPIQPMIRLRRIILSAIEAGDSLHISLGRGSLLSQNGISGLVGLQLLREIANNTAFSDRPSVGTSGEATLGLLSHQIFQNNYTYPQKVDLSHFGIGYTCGFTPFSYAAASLTHSYNPHTRSTILLGNFGSEIALILSANESGIACTDHLIGQAVVYAMAASPILGEELFNSTYYVKANKERKWLLASMQMEDILRWLLMAILILGSLAKWMRVF